MPPIGPEHVSLLRMDKASREANNIRHVELVSSYQTVVQG